MGEEESDVEIIAEAENSIRNLKSEIDKRQIDVLLSGEADPNDTYLEVHAGAGEQKAKIGLLCCCVCICAGLNSMK